MTTRISLETFVNTALLSIQQNASRMLDLQEKISSGKKINRPSDDPAGASNILSLRSEKLKLEQYSSNIQTATQSLDFNASTLQNVSSILQRAQELTIQGVDDSKSQSDRNIIAGEINQLLESILREANSKLSGRYVFAGTKTTTTPFTATRNTSGNISAVTYNGNNEKIEYQVGPGFNVQVNQPGQEAFIDSKIFSTLISVRDSLSSGAMTFARNELDNINSAHEAVLNLISRAGGIASTLELTRNRVEDTKLSVNSFLASTESADLSELVLKLKEQENIFQASLASGTLIFRTTILDFM